MRQTDTGSVHTERTLQFCYLQTTLIAHCHLTHIQIQPRFLVPDAIYVYLQSVQSYMIIVKAINGWLIVLVLFQFSVIYHKAAYAVTLLTEINLSCIGGSMSQPGIEAKRVTR